MCSYGFVPEGVNRHEAVDLHLALRDDDALRTQKAQALAALGLPSEQQFPLQLGAFPAGMLLVCRSTCHSMSSNLGCSVYAALCVVDLLPSKELTLC